MKDRIVPSFSQQIALKWTFQNRTQVILTGLLSALTLFLYGQLFVKNTIVNIDIDTNVTSTFQIYWAEAGQPYDEARSSLVRINPIQKRYIFSIPGLEKLERLRVDPAKWWNKTPPKIVIRKMTISQEGYAPIQFSTEDDFRQLVPIYDIAKMEIVPTGLRVIPKGDDPQLELRLKLDEQKSYFLQFIRLLLIIAGWTLFFRLIPRLTDNFDYICYVMSFIAAIILLMAIISERDSHPDEYVHLSAASYFQDHWLPPEICTPGTEHTYSIYGISRLNSSEIAYLLAGKFSKLLSFFPLAEFIRLRLFNVALFITLLVLGLLNAYFRPVLIPVLVTPQIWYVFSYFNSDAFAIFVIFAIGFIVINSEGRFYQFIDSPPIRKQPVHYMLYGLLFSFLLSIKINYYSFILFLFLYFIWRSYFKPFTHPRAVKLKLGIIFLLAGLFYLPGYLALNGVNDFKKHEKIIECREKLAWDVFKPSTTIEKGHPWMKLKERGVSLVDIIINKDYQWAKRVFGNFFGTYHYTTILAPKACYRLSEIVMIVLLLFIVSSVLILTGPKEKILLGIVLACSLALIGAMVWRAWVVFFQAQGRYVFPILGMFGILLFHVEKYVHRTFLTTLIFLMFMLSSYSFVFIGLVSIPKY